MLRRRQTRSALEVFIYNRYEDTAFLIFKESIDRRKKQNENINENTPTAWKEISDNANKDLPGSSGVHVGKSPHQERHVHQLNRLSLLPQNGVNPESVVISDHTNTTVCVIL